MRREAVIETWVNARAKEDLGILPVKLKQAGLPDQGYVLHGGGFVMIEYKDPSGVISPLQTLTHQRLRAMGHDVQVFSDKVKALLYLEMRQKECVKAHAKQIAEHNDKKVAANRGRVFKSIDDVDYRFTNR